ncbi:hypothetical protein JCM19297_2159 [Nonlabens ulvanivorans]|nr:hypothetical protein JCM19297_2159 [Nonlabens ulvanivorans]
MKTINDLIIYQKFLFIKTIMIMIIPLSRKRNTYLAIAN